LCLGLVLSSCGGGDGQAGDGRLFVVATTGMVGDMVQAIGGDEVDVKVLMGAGIDPHSYKPVMKDTTAMARAKIVFYSGLLLEGKMESNWQSHSSKSHAVASVLPEERLKGDEHHPDPHVWGDVELWAMGIDGVVGAFVKHDPDGAEGYLARGEAYRERLAELHQWALERAKGVPESSRVMVTSHDAFEYFGAAYGFEVFGLLGISTVGSHGARDRAALGEIIKARNVKMIFPESSVNPTSIQSVAEDTGVAVSKIELFSDAMGVLGKMEEVNGESYDLGTYEGMIKHNMNALVEGLK
ncbi:MAG: manganese/zinc/iron transport system substrate-binding protein, partial [Verrucomicrobiales bacterium]